MSNGLDPDQGRRSVGPDLDPNCLQRLSADDKIFESLILFQKRRCTFRVSQLNLYDISSF